MKPDAALELDLDFIAGLTVGGSEATFRLALMPGFGAGLEAGVEEKYGSNFEFAPLCAPACWVSTSAFKLGSTAVAGWCRVSGEVSGEELAEAAGKVTCELAREVSGKFSGEGSDADSGDEVDMDDASVAAKPEGTGGDGGLIGLGATNVAAGMGIASTCIAAPCGSMHSTRQFPEIHRKPHDPSC